MMPVDSTHLMVEGRNRSRSSESGMRPSFSSTVTSDRLREANRQPTNSTSPAFRASSNAARISVFKEVGLLDDEIANDTGLSTVRSSSPSAHAGRLSSSRSPSPKQHSDDESKDTMGGKGGKSWLAKIAKPSRPVIRTTSSAPPATFSTLPRVALIVFLIAIVVPGFNYRGAKHVPMDGADAGVIMRAELVENGSTLEGRADSPVNTCTRWSHQSAVVNGTVYIYGGQAKTSSDQTNNTWNNNFLKLDLSKSWQISSPALAGLPQPSGPPAVANAYLWNSYTSLFLYGGEFADNNVPPTSPIAVSTWEYNLISSSWVEHANPVTSGGNNSDVAGQPVQRSAEGAGLSVPELGLSWYFGGHQDDHTTQGWSNQIRRIYLRSLLEFTHPGFMNSGVQGLGNGGKGAPAGGAYRNITQGGIQEDAGFTERADGVLVYVPGWGASGIILGLAGGTADKFTELSPVIDIFDIATSTWYKQATSGQGPSIRVNPCAAVFAASDASSFNVYMYGGQNLQPAGNQTQYSDLWILTIPSFTWISVDLSGQSQPAGRAGHSCHAWDGQLVVIGGYVGKQISCDSPGIFVFNASSLMWQNTFTALESSSSSGSNSGSGQKSPQGSSPFMSGSFGYQVPPKIQSIVGGNGNGGATVTSPASGPATDGPIATGTPPSFAPVTITQSGSTIIQTAGPTRAPAATAQPTNTPTSSSNVGAITAGVIAGVLALLAGYLAFCTWLYRRQLALYKNHVAMSQRTALGFSNSPDNRTAYTGGRYSEKAHGPGPLLGVFGTEIGRDSTTERTSMGGSSGPSSGPAPKDSNSFNSGMASPGFSREEPNPTGGEAHHMEYPGLAGVPSHPEWGGISHTANSSTEDLIAGHEPSFFSVVLSPRQTLRVINRD